MRMGVVRECQKRFKKKEKESIDREELYVTTSRGKREHQRTQPHPLVTTDDQQARDDDDGDAAAADKPRRATAGAGAESLALLLFRATTLKTH